MSLETVNYQTFVDRVAETFEKDSTLFPQEESAKMLVTKVIRNRPPIEQSADDGVIPYILVFSSGQPIRFMEKAGRDTRNIEGGGVYELEIYCVAITNNEITRSGAVGDIDTITQAMRNALARNMRLAVPATFTDPLCRTHTRFEINYLLRGDVPATMIARNVVVRPQVYVSPRSA